MAEYADREVKKVEEILEELFALAESNATRNSLARKQMNFGRFLCSARTNASFTLQELANKTEVPLHILARIETGQFLIEYIKDEWIERLATVLEEDVDEFDLILGRFVPSTEDHEIGKESVDGVATLLSELVKQKRTDFGSVIRTFMKNDVDPKFVRAFIYKFPWDKDAHDEDDPLPFIYE